MLLKPLFLALLCLVASLHAAPAEDGDGDGNTPKIVGGQEVSPPFKYPWMVRVWAVRAGVRYLCGGSLIAPNWVLTAGHCSVDVDAEDSNVLIHRHDLREDDEDEGGVTAGVKRVILHPLYDDNSLEYDVALWELTESHDFEPVKLDFEATGFTAGEDSVVIGWGDTTEGGNQSPVLKQATLKLLNFNLCSSYYSGTDSNIQVCAGILAGGTDSCQGDSGGPLVVERDGEMVQIGVVSFGEGCAREDVPGVYARVSGVKTWIQTFVQFPSDSSDASWVAPGVFTFLVVALAQLFLL